MEPMAPRKPRHSNGNISIAMMALDKPRPCRKKERRRIPKISYDNPGNVPNKGKNFNTQTFRKMYLLFVWLAAIGFRKNYFYILPNFGDFGAKMSFFNYIINKKRNNFIKHCSPVYQEAADIRDVYRYKKFAVQVGSWYTGGGGGGGRCSIDKKSKGCRLTTQ